MNSSSESVYAIVCIAYRGVSDLLALGFGTSDLKRNEKKRTITNIWLKFIGLVN